MGVWTTVTGGRGIIGADGAVEEGLGTMTATQIANDSTMREVLVAFPSAQRALMRRYRPYNRSVRQARRRSGSFRGHRPAGQDEAAQEADREGTARERVRGGVRRPWHSLSF